MVRTRLEDAEAYLQQLDEAATQEGQKVREAREMLASAESRLKATQRAQHAVFQYLQRSGESSASEPVAHPDEQSESAPGDEVGSAQVIVRDECRETVRRLGSASIDEIVSEVQSVRPGTSRETIRKALSHVVSKGILARAIHGAYSVSTQTIRGAA